MKDIFELIEKYDTITIFGHIYPDGDCYGSEAGLREALKYFYPKKQVYAIGSGFSKVPPYFPKMDEVDDETIKNSLAIIVDLSSVDRLEDARALTAKDCAKIDHHIFQQNFGTVEIVDEGKVSSTLIITELLIKKFGLIPQSAAGPLLLGLITDSGRFQYQPFNQETFYLTGRLIEFGADLKAIYDALYVVEEKSLRFKGYIYLNYQKHSAGIAYLVLTKEILAEYGYDENSGAAFVNSLAGIDGMYAWVFFAEAEDGHVRVELRSSAFPVQPTAVAFNGGGHRCASGCKLSCLSDYIKVLEHLDMRIQEAQK